MNGQIETIQNALMELPRGYSDAAMALRQLETYLTDLKTERDALADRVKGLDAQVYRLSGDLGGLLK